LALDRSDRSRRRRTTLASVAAAAALTLALVAAPAATAAGRPPLKLTAAEKVFVKQYERLIPALDRASAALVKAVDDASKFSNAQVASVFTAVAKQWASATKPLLGLAVPAQVASIVAVIALEVPSVEADLLAAADSGRSENGSAARAAGLKLALDYNKLLAAVAKLKLKLSLP
jgi:hypothetical protein